MHPVTIRRKLLILSIASVLSHGSEPVLSSGNANQVALAQLQVAAAQQQTAAAQEQQRVAAVQQQAAAAPVTPLAVPAVVQAVSSAQQVVQAPVQQAAVPQLPPATVELPAGAVNVRVPLQAPTNPVNAQSSAVSNDAAVAQASRAASAASAAKTAAEAASVAAAAASTAVNAASAANAAAKSVTSPPGQQSAKTATEAKTADNAKTAIEAANVAAVAANAAASAASVANAAAKTVTGPPSQTVPAEVPVQVPQLVQAALPVRNLQKPAQVVTVPRFQTPDANAWSTTQWYFSQGMQLVYGLTFATIIKGLCVAGNVLVQISPFPQVKRWEQRGCTGEADSAPYVSIAFGGWQWCFYGLFAWVVTARSGFLILVHSNCLGAVLGVYYVITFYRNCRSELSLASMHKYLSAVTSLALLQVCAMSVLPAERALFLTGLVSSFCSFIGATSVLVTLPQVIREKDGRSIPGPYAVANFMSSFVWSLCGWMLDDPMVMVPNMFSTCCSMTSLALKALYLSDEDKMTKAEEDLPLPVPNKKADVAHAVKKQKAAEPPTEFTPIMNRKPAMETSTFPDSLKGAGERVAALFPGFTGGSGGTGDSW